MRAISHALRAETTYIFFGRRGSGKTTIRLSMQKAYAQHNESVRASGVSRGHFIVDLSRPGHLTACLRTFQESTGCTDDNWDASFGAVMGDCGRGKSGVSCEQVAAVKGVEWRAWSGQQHAGVLCQGNRMRSLP